MIISGSKDIILKKKKKDQSALEVKGKVSEVNVQNICLYNDWSISREGNALELLGWC